MEIQISMREANQHLSRYIEQVEQGAEVVITRRGKSVARLTAIDESVELSSDQVAARDRLLAKMQQGYALGGQRVDRDSIYDEAR